MNHMRPGRCNPVLKGNPPKDKDLSRLISSSLKTVIEVVLPERAGRSRYVATRPESSSGEPSGELSLRR